MKLKFIKEINSIFDDFSSLSDDDFKRLALEFKQEVENTKNLTNKKFNKFLPKALAFVKAAISRVFTINAYDNQLLAAKELFENKIVELNPGEGKTLVVILSAYLKVLMNKKVHIMVENDFMIQRNYFRVNKIFSLLGFTVGAVTSKASSDFELMDKKEMYSKDIVYIHPIESAFDYLKSQNKNYIESVDLIIDDIDKLIATPEPKSVVLVKENSVDTDNILLLDFVKKYNTYCGIADFALKERKFYKKFLNKEVVFIPSNFKNIRVDLPDNISITKQEKYDKIIKEVSEVHRYRCPVVIVVPNVEELKDITSLLDKRGFNFKTIKGEDYLMDVYHVSQIGCLNQVTVLSQIIGIDSPLGGNAYYKTLYDINSMSNKSVNDESAEFQNVYNFNIIKNKKDEAAIKELGGIYTIITEHTIDDDFYKSISGRRGQAGSSKFFISLEDDFLKRINMNKFFEILNSLNLSQEKILNNKIISAFIVKCADFVNKTKNRLVD